MNKAIDNFVVSEGVTQKTMALMADVAPSTISRAISSAGFNPIPNSSKGKLRYSVSDVRAILDKFISAKYKINKKAHCFYNFKGGVGKTSICFQVATHLALMGFNVLVVDADPQGHLSTSLGFNNDDSYYTLYDAIVGIKPINEIIHNIYEGLDCVPSNLSLTRTEVSLNEMPKREERVSLLLKPIADRYDFVIFDTNPTISYLNRNIITCCDVINIVVETQAYSLNGVKLLLSDITSFCTSMMIDLPEIFMFPNKYEDRAATSAEAMAVLNKIYSKYLIPDFAVRKSEEFNIASKLSKALAFFCRHNSIALEDVLEIIHFLIKKCSLTEENT
jgi:chromosome partitioning protein